MILKRHGYDYKWKLALVQIVMVNHDCQLGGSVLPRGLVRLRHIRDHFQNIGDNMYCKAPNIKFWDKIKEHSKETVATATIKHHGSTACI